MNDNEIMVSISCLTYCHEKYIRQCLDGFLMQKTNFKFEVLIHDDASPDGTADIIREYAEKYPDIIKPIFQTENQYSRGGKIGATYQAPRIKGKYVALCEGDDYWTDPLKLQKQFDVLEKNTDCHMCVHKVLVVNKNGDSYNKCVYPRRTSGIIEKQEFFEAKNKGKYLYQTSSYFLRTQTYLEYCFDPPKYITLSPVGDEALQFFFILKGNVFFLDDVMSCYRFGVPGSYSSTYFGNDEKLKIHLSKMISFYEEFEKYVDYEYDLSFIIAADKYRCFSLNEDYKKAFAVACNNKGMFSKREVFSCFLRAYFPTIYKLQRKLRGKSIDE